MRIIAAFIPLFFVFCSASFSADTKKLDVDVNVVTAVDVSGSIGLHGEGFQFKALAAAIEHPDFLQAIRRGYRRRIGFSVITWSSKGGFSIVVDWELIDSERKAAAVSRQLRDAIPIAQFGYTKPDPNLRRPRWRRGLSTDISTALHLALDWLDEAPFPSARSVINLCTNGPDNVSEGPELGRMRAVQSDIVINGLIIGDRPEVAAYFREQVQTGPGSFVIEAKQPEDVLDAILRKFILDLAIDMEPTEEHHNDAFQLFANELDGSAERTSPRADVKTGMHHHTMMEPVMR